MITSLSARHSLQVDRGCTNQRPQRHNCSTIVRLIAISKLCGAPSFVLRALPVFSAFPELQTSPMKGTKVGALETQEFRTTPIPFWLICFSDTVKGPLRQMFFVVLLPDGTVVEPKVAKRL